MEGEEDGGDAGGVWEPGGASAEDFGQLFPNEEVVKSDT